ncbi:unnamed protein product, partial [Phaeothamnion confervicola]
DAQYALAAQLDVLSERLGLDIVDGTASAAGGAAAAAAAAATGSVGTARESRAAIGEASLQHSAPTAAEPHGAENASEGHRGGDDTAVRKGTAEKAVTPTTMAADPTTVITDAGDGAAPEQVTKHLAVQESALRAARA